MNSRISIFIWVFLLFSIPVLSTEQNTTQFKIAPEKVQIYLDRAGFSCGQIDGVWGFNTRNTLEIFQQSHSLPTTGEINQQTWDKLTSQDNVPLLVKYTISSTDTDGPFATEIPKEMMKQAELPALSYISTLEVLGEKFHCSPLLLRKLNPNAQFIEGEDIKVPNIIQRVYKPKISDDTTNNKPPVKIIISTKKRYLNVFDDSGKLLFHAPITPGGKKNPPPYGEWTVNKIAWNPSFYYNPKLFWDADTADTKAIIQPGPNNPVGVVWLNLTAKNYGIHGTPIPANIGYKTSHGCVRMTNWDALRVADMVKPGETPVIIRE